MIGLVIIFAGGSCRVETSQLTCSENHLTGFIFEWTIVYLNSFEQLSEEYGGIFLYVLLQK